MKNKALKIKFNKFVTTYSILILTIFSFALYITTGSMMQKRMYNDKKTELKSITSVVTKLIETNNSYYMQIAETIRLIKYGANNENYFFIVICYRIGLHCFN